MTRFARSEILEPPPDEPAPVVLDDELCLDLDQERAVARLIHAALSATGYSTLRDVTVVVQCQALTLAGRVPTYYQKQLAQEIAQRFAGQLMIENAIDVVLRSNRAALP